MEKMEIVKMALLGAVAFVIAVGALSMFFMGVILGNEGARSTSENTILVEHRVSVWDYYPPTGCMSWRENYSWFENCALENGQVTIYENEYVYVNDGAPAFTPINDILLFFYKNQVHVLKLVPQSPLSENQVVPSTQTFCGYTVSTGTVDSYGYLNVVVTCQNWDPPNRVVWYPSVLIKSEYGTVEYVSETPVDLRALTVG